MSVAALARTVIIGPSPTVIAGNTDIPVAPAWPAKDPADTAFYSADFGLVLTGAQVITAAAATPTGPTGLPTLATPMIDGTVVTFLASGGSDQTRCPVRLAITLNDGETIHRTVILPVLQQP